MNKEEKEIKNTDAAEKPKKTKKEKVKKEKRTFNKRKFKYGTLATAITVVFIAAVVLLNVLASQLTDRFGLKIDTTKEQLFEISDQTIDYLENGNIVNSVNFPRLTMERSGKARVCVLTKNADPAAVTTAVGSFVASSNAVKGDYGYMMFDVDAQPDTQKIASVPGVLKVIVK